MTYLSALTPKCQMQWLEKKILKFGEDWILTYKLREPKNAGRLQWGTHTKVRGLSININSTLEKKTAKQQR